MKRVLPTLQLLPKLPLEKYGKIFRYCYRYNEDITPFSFYPFPKGLAVMQSGLQRIEKISVKQREDVFNLFGKLQKGMGKRKYRGPGVGSQL